MLQTSFTMMNLFNNSLTYTNRQIITDRTETVIQKELAVMIVASLTVNTQKTSANICIFTNIFSIFYTVHFWLPTHGGQ